MNPNPLSNYFTEPTIRSRRLPSSVKDRVRIVIAAGLTSLVLSACANNRPHLSSVEPNLQQQWLHRPIHAWADNHGPAQSRTLLPDGTTRLIWSKPLQGWATAIEINPEGIILKIENPLQIAEFAKIKAGVWYKKNVEQHFGPPAQVVFFPERKSEVWTYTYYQGGRMILHHLYFDVAGVLRFTNQSVDPLLSKTSNQPTQSK